MRKKIVVAIALIIALFYVLPINAQQKDNCGSIIGKNQITIPCAKDGIIIQFFYSKTGKFSYNNLDFVPPTFINEIGYTSWEELISDFPSSSKDFALIKFDWSKLAQFGEYNNWEAIVKNSEGKTYIGSYLDITKNHDANNIKIVEITSTCFHPSCQPDKLSFTVRVYLAEK